MQTIEVDDETFADLDALAKRRHTTVSRLIQSALQRMTGGQRAEEPVIQAPHGYKIPISKGLRPFTIQDVWAAEDENDMRGLQ